MTIEKVLIVDDEPLLRDFLSELLLTRGLSPFTADNVKQGCHKIKTEKYDLIISDMNMPDGTGIDIIKTAKECAPHTPVLVITAYG
ncbi:response regulator, partial [Chlamydia psittaci 84-8471/1]